MENKEEIVKLFEQQFGFCATWKMLQFMQSEGMITAEECLDLKMYSNKLFEEMIKN